MQVLIGLLIAIFFIVLKEIEKSDIRRILNGERKWMKKENKIKENTGIIPIIYKRIICTLWKGHEFVQVSPRNIDGSALFECKYCKKQKIF